MSEPKISQWFINECYNLGIPDPEDVFLVIILNDTSRLVFKKSMTKEELKMRFDFCEQWIAEKRKICELQSCAIDLSKQGEAKNQ